MFPGPRRPDDLYRTGWGAALLLGLLQGLAEWLPVSSEGMVAAVYGLTCGGGLADGVEYALWLHAGTKPAMLVALRREAAAGFCSICWVAYIWREG